MTSTRKYRRSVGEHESFDRSGVLREKALSHAGATALVYAMMALVPELGQEPIVVVFESGRSKTNGKVNVKNRVITLYEGGRQAKTVLHELAHLAAPPVHRGSWWDRHHIGFQVACQKLERVFYQQAEKHAGEPLGV